MMRLSIISFLFVVTIVSCKKSVDINEIFADTATWEVLSISLYDGFIGDIESVSVIQHHKDVGDFKFENGGAGTYTFNKVETPITWQLTGSEKTGSLAIGLSVDDPIKLESYFVYYQVGGFLGDYRNTETTYIVQVINENTIQLRDIPEFYSSTGTFSTEIILGKIQN